jgi:type II secretory pathway pseudopilin PulG
MKFKIQNSKFKNCITGFGILNFRSRKYANGITLLETVIYVALLTGISILMINSMLQIVDVYQRARLEREVLSNARLILETLQKSIAQAETIYWPTSLFNQSAGQLSLVTTISAQPEHTTAFIDYYLDNGRLWLKKEGSQAIPLSAATVRVVNFRLERIMQSLDREAVKITLQVDAANQKYATSITLNSTTAVRGNY